MACTAYLVSFFSTVIGRSQKKRRKAKNPLEDVALVAAS
jgi:hypothetical protein